MYLTFATHTEAKQAAREGKTAVVLALGQTFLYLPTRFEIVSDEDLARLVAEYFSLGGLEDRVFAIETETGCCSVALPTCWRADLYAFDERRLRAFIAALDHLI